MIRVARSLLVVLILSTLAACYGPDGSSTSSDSSGEVDASTGADATGDAGENSSSSSSTSDASSPTGDACSTGDADEQVCFGVDCTVSCGAGLVCTPHPDNASRPVCAAPDLCTTEGIGAACAVDIEGCDGPVIGECRASSLWSVMCFPIL